MAHLQDQPGFVGQFLQFKLPQPHSRPVRTAAIGCDQQSIRRVVTLAAHGLMPAADRIDCERRRVMVDPDADPARVRGDVVDAVRRDLAEFLVDEVMHFHLIGAAGGAVVAAAVLVLADQLHFLRINGDHRLAGRLKSNDFAVDMLELPVTVGGWLPSFVLRLTCRE